MAYPLSDPVFNLASALEALREAAHQGDWTRAERLVESLGQAPLPAEPEALAAHLANLREALIIARASRSHLTLKLNRIRAAAGFLNGRKLSSGRHDFAEPLVS